MAWCIHPDLIPREKIIFISKPPIGLDDGLPLFVRPEDVIYHKHLMLRYRVLIDVLEVADWHEPSDSLDGGFDIDVLDSWLRPW
jgi:hypothetical protein